MTKRWPASIAAHGQRNRPTRPLRRLHCSASFPACWISAVLRAGRRAAAPGEVRQTGPVCRSGRVGAFLYCGGCLEHPVSLFIRIAQAVRKKHRAADVSEGAAYAASRPRDAGGSFPEHGRLQVRISCLSWYAAVAGGLEFAARYITKRGGIVLEEFLFQCYLKYLKDIKKDKSNLFGRFGLFKMSSSYIVLLVLGLCFVFIFVLLSFLRSDYTIYFALTSFLCLFLLSRYTDYIRMDKSVARLSIYKANCRALVDWMLENCEIELDNNLLERLIPRLERLAEDEKHKEEKSQKRMDDMLRLVLIPVILSTLTEIIKDQNLTTVISYSIAALTIFFMFCMIEQYGLQMQFFFSRQRAEKLRLFISDLRSISDMRGRIIRPENGLEKRNTTIVLKRACRPSQKKTQRSHRGLR